MPDSSELSGSSDPVLAASLLKAGKLVAFPTETVYGLGADATSSAACKKIFAAKGRPDTNPLIVHVADVATAKHYVADWPEMAQRLADEFWPGPLTLVLPRRPSIAEEAAAGRQTVAIRVPDHPLALAMLKSFGGPVAAPSANKSTRVSPTTADHVRAELGDKVDLILDGGACPVGIESTVLDLTTFPQPTLLRPGNVSAAEIEQIIGPVTVLSRTIVDARESAPSPGMSEVHYAPRTPAFRFPREHYLEAMARLTKMGMTPSILLLLSRANIPGPHDVITMPQTPEGYARVLYARLRGADIGGYDSIFIELPPDAPEWLAVRDRLIRATRPL